MAASSNPDVDSDKEAKSDVSVKRDDEDEWEGDGWENEDDWGDMNVSDSQVSLDSKIFPSSMRVNYFL